MLNNPSNSDYSPSEAILKKVNLMLTTGNIEYFDSQTFVDVMEFFNSQYKYKDSISLGSFGLKIHSNSSNIHLKKAQAYSNLNNIELAKEHLNVAEQFDQKNGDVHLTKGMLFSKEGFTEKAIESYREAATLLEYPEDAYPYLAFELKALNKFQEAISILKRYLKEYPDDEMCSSMLFGILEELEYNQLGVKIYTELVSLSAFNHLNWFYLGLFNKSLDQREKAFNAFEYSYLLESKFAAAYHEMANLLIEDKLYEKAIYYLEEVIEIEEPYAMTYTRLAELYRFTNNFSKALSSARKAVKEDPQLDSAWFELGLILFELDDFESAQTAFGNAKGLNETEFDYQLYYANTFMRLKNWSIAKDLMVNIINTFGMNISLLKNILICSIHTLDFEDALTYSLKATEYSKDVDFLYFTAYFYYKQNNREQTLLYIIKAINQNVDRMSTIKILMKDMFEETYIKSLVPN